MTLLPRHPSPPISHPRRHCLQAALATAVGLKLSASPAQAASSAPGSNASPGLGAARCTVSATRLDALLAEAFPRFNAPRVLPGFDAARHGARHDVELHRLNTEVTVPETGERLKVTGLLALPLGVKGPIPVLSWQHGTVLGFDQVPSGLLRLADPAYQTTDEKDSLETLLNVHRFAGQGYAVIAADYVGKGPLRQGRGEGYAVKGVTVSTCMAMIEAGMARLRALKAQPGPLFLNGWSQGGLNTQWLHQQLRRQGRPVRATAVASPFNDLSESWRFWAGVQTFPLPDGVSTYPAMPDWVSLCMIVALGSYQVHYRLDGLLKSAIRPEFHDMALKYWSDYAIDFDPNKPFPSGRNLLVPGFFEKYTDERNSEFLRRLAANTASYWRYDRPIRFHYGLADEAIHPAMVARALSAGGAQAGGVAVAGASHRGTFLASLYGQSSHLAGRENILDWFNTFRR
jgi:hypothetical protein